MFGFSVFLSLILTTLEIGLDIDSYHKAAGIVMDYKIHVDAGKEDCYYHEVRPGSTLYVSYQVLKGGDGMAGFAVRHPNGHHVHPYQWKQESDYEEEKSLGGVYQICLDNQFSRFAAKLVNLYITTFSHDDWDKFTEEIGKEMEMAHEGVKNFTDTLQNVDTRVGTMLKFQQKTRSNEARDLALVEGNFTYVSYWSLLQVLAILTTTIVQVVFVRRLFETKNSRGGGI